MDLGNNTEGQAMEEGRMKREAKKAKDRKTKAKGMINNAESFMLDAQTKSKIIARVFPVVFFAFILFASTVVPVICGPDKGTWLPERCQE